MSDPQKCPNCQSLAPGNYCANCGQEQGLSRLSFKGILSDFFSSAFNLEGPFFRTVIKMFSRPQKLIIEVAQGGRKKYYSPVKYLLLCLLIFVLLEVLSGYDPVKISDPTRGKEGAAVANFILNNINYFALLLPFALALISKLFFWKHPFNMAERTALGFYISGQYMLINLIPLGLSFIKPELASIRYLINVLYFAFVFYMVFQGSTKWWTMIKSLLGGFLSMVFYFLLTWLFAYFYISIIQPLL